MFTKRYSSGVTLVELIIAMVIIGVVSVGVVVATRTSSANADPIRRKQALLIAEGLMDEVLTAHYTLCDPSDQTANSAQFAIIDATSGCTSTVEALGPEPGNVRPFDNVSDYGPNFSFINGVGEVLDANGQAMTPKGYTATVTVNPVIPAAQPLGPQPPAPNGVVSSAVPANMQAVLITVTVGYGTGPGDSIRLDAYRTRYAPRDF